MICVNKNRACHIFLAQTCKLIVKSEVIYFINMQFNDRTCDKASNPYF